MMRYSSIILVLVGTGIVLLIIVPGTQCLVLRGAFNSSRPGNNKINTSLSVVLLFLHCHTVRMVYLLSDRRAIADTDGSIGLEFALLVVSMTSRDVATQTYMKFTECF